VLLAVAGSLFEVPGQQSSQAHPALIFYVGALWVAGSKGTAAPAQNNWAHYFIYLKGLRMKRAPKGALSQGLVRGLKWDTGWNELALPKSWSNLNFILADRGHALATHSFVSYLAIPLTMLIIALILY